MKNQKKYVIIILMVAVISLGFSLLTSNLIINLGVDFAQGSWDVHFENINVNDKSIEASLPQISQDNTSITFGGAFSEPGEFYEFTVDIVNAGTMDAVLDELIKSSLNQTQATYINYTVNYWGDRQIQENDILPAGYKEKIKVRVEYKYDIDELIQLDDMTFTLTMNYVKRNLQSTYNNEVWNLDYTGGQQVFTVPKTGNYKLEVWGAQGGYSDKYEYIGGYGGYSVGTISLIKNNNLYINVGGKGESCYGSDCIALGGYNGGGDCRAHDRAYNDKDYYTTCGAGGGATHIASITGALYELELSKDKILIVSGAGGGGVWTNGANNGFGGSGGGYIGGNAICNAMGSIQNGYGTGGTQLEGGYRISGGRWKDRYGSFGQGYSNSSFTHSEANTAGGGGGFYGGGGTAVNAAGGGSGYIGNSLLSEKAMYCYNCQEPDVNDENYDNIKTISTTNVSEEPISQYAKIGNGYARITFIQ